MLDCYIPYGYLANELSQKFDAKIFAFQNVKEKNIINLIRYYMMLLNPLSRFNIYKSFGVKKLISFFSNDEKTKIRINSEFNKVLKNTKSKRQFEKLKILR